MDGGGTLSPEMFVDFVPGWPEAPVHDSPQNAALGVTGSVSLKWRGAGGRISTISTLGRPTLPRPHRPELHARLCHRRGEFNQGVLQSGSPPAGLSPRVPGLAPGTTYYWRVRGKTMVGDGGGPFNAPARIISGPVWSFTRPAVTRFLKRPKASSATRSPRPELT